MVAVVLDLDETLIYSSICYLPTSCEYFFLHDCYFYIRPFTKELIQFLNEEHIPFGIYSSAEKLYVDDVLKYVLKTDRHQFAFSNNQCLCGHKDLNVIWDQFVDFKPNKTLFVDDKDILPDDQRANWLPIAPWSIHKDFHNLDTELASVIRLLDCLKELLKNPKFDVRDLLAHHWKMER